MTSQDFNKGLDFTGLGVQTAAEHNQLVDLATTVDDGSAPVGKGLVLTTTDSALGVPSVPNPTSSPDFNKWARYVWNRRPFAGATDKTGWLYQWNDDTGSVATYLKWLLIDKAAQTTVGGALGTPLQAAIDTIATDSANADAAATAANSAVAALQADCLGSVPVGTVSPDLLTKINTNRTDIDTNTTNISSINTWAGGVNGLVGTGGVNGQLASLQTQINTVSINAANVANLLPGTTRGAMLRTGLSGSGGIGNPEWFDPTDINNLVSGTDAGAATYNPNGSNGITTTPGTLTLQPGIYFVAAALSGRQSHNAGANDGSWLAMKYGGVGGTALILGPKVVAASATTGPIPATLVLIGIATITQAMGATAITFCVVNDANSTTFFGAAQHFAVTMQRISLSV